VQAVERAMHTHHSLFPTSAASSHTSVVQIFLLSQCDLGKACTHPCGGFVRPCAAQTGTRDAVTVTTTLA
jgi:hypothetical protein